ncbi:integrase catalytic domain-containing protein [Trichonephila clavipes]|nr:integrase catalytic domain-containing protein [Trichonephila clavipes]
MWGMESFLLGDELTRGYAAENILSDFGKEVKKKMNVTRYLSNGRIKGIKGNLSSNFDVAEKRFISLEKRFNRDDLLFERYNSVMKEQLKQGIKEKCAKNCFAGYAMPHREVFRENSSKSYETLNESLYVDDLFFGSSTVQEAFKLSSEAVLIPKEASMNASPKSFGAVAYLRYKISDNNFNTKFVISKSRVAPIKKITLPMLELKRAVIAAKLVKHLKRILKDIERIILWSDSTIVLYWIKGSTYKFKSFVSNRISEIQENTDPASWRHCSGKQNPADLLTRGLTSKELINSEKWWHGPEWLKYSENLWPKLEGFESLESEIVELKSSLIVNLTITHNIIINPDKYSSLLKLLRITAYVFRFVNALRRKGIVKGPLAAEELSNAEIFWVKVTQNDFYTSEITCLKSNKTLQKDSKLLRLNPLLDDNGVLRVTGRLGKITHLSANEKHPIILPSKSRLTELLIWESHKRVFHILVYLTHWCSQATAPLPDVCVTESPTFSVVGLDFAGPLFVKDNDAKQYILLITCAVTRSIHLELVGSMTTDTYLIAFRRFVARRGLCTMVISDNARTFKCAELQLQQMWKVLNHEEVKNFYSAHSIKWKYIVERAAWWGGLYERMVRSMKVALRNTLGRSSLTNKQLLTVLIEIERIINSRPITYVGSETEEPIPLTPAHFIIGKRITSLPPVRLHLDSKLSSRKCLIKGFNYREKLLRSFWSRWKNEYLLNLRSAHCSTFKNASQFKINDVVLIKDDQLSRNFWKLGKHQLFPGRDGKVRACKIKKDSFIIKRPVQLLYNLEIQD